MPFFILHFITKSSFVFAFLQLFLHKEGLHSVGYFALTSITKAKGNLFFQTQHLCTDNCNLLQNAFKTKERDGHV